MNGHRQLRWIQRNRGSRKAEVDASALMHRLFDGLATGVATCPDDLVMTVSEAVDDEFRAHCRLSIGQGRVLSVNVDRPELVAVLSRRWSSVIRRKLAGPRGRLPVSGITFKLGQSGRSIPQPGLLPEQKR